jgi:hypothetical protein
MPWRSVVVDDVDCVVVAVAALKLKPQLIRLKKLINFKINYLLTINVRSALSNFKRGVSHKITNSRVDHIWRHLWTIPDKNQHSLDDFLSNQIDYRRLLSWNGLWQHLEIANKCNNNNNNNDNNHDLMLPYSYLELQTNVTKTTTTGKKATTTTTTAITTMIWCFLTKF